ncbi:MAG: hypothetical protein LUD51_05720 [Clostridia bacterium]|nr:hypothetical protein [Clostridia bacterium]
MERNINNLDFFPDFIRRLKRSGLNGEDFFEFLLMTFNENFVKCKSNGRIMTGTLFIEHGCDEMTVSIWNFKTGKEYKLPVSAIKWIKEIDREEV